MTNLVAGVHHNYSFPIKTCPSTLSILKEQFQLNIISYDSETLKFEIFNLPSDLQNALRRLIINEVPSVAFDRVYIYNNTTCIDDNELQLRIGFIPIDVDPDDLETHKNPLSNTAEVSSFEQDASLLYELNLNFKKSNINMDKFNKFIDPKNKGVTNKFLPIFKKRRDKSIYSDDLILRPFTNTKPKLRSAKPIGDILLVRIMPGEEINVKALAVKGYGHDHAKFMPVNIAYGKMVNTIKLLQPIKGESAKRLQKLYPEGVIKIKKGCAVVGDTRLIQRTNKNFHEFDDLKGKIEIGFDEKHYLWEIESNRPTNQPPNKILISSLQAMIDKCNFYQNNLNSLNEAIIKLKSGSFDEKSLSKMVLGKLCYLEKNVKSKKLTLYRFYGESATLGTSLSWMLNYLYGENIDCAYVDIEFGIELMIQSNIGGNKKLDDILLDGLDSMENLFEYMIMVFKQKMDTFSNNDIDME